MTRLPHQLRPDELEALARCAEEARRRADRSAKMLTLAICLAAALYSLGAVLLLWWAPWK